MTTDTGARGMNIRDHILAGHYPTDDKGRALVPMGSGRIATITATDMPGRKPIVGWIAVETLAKATEWSWMENGQGHKEMPTPDDLLPPLPRKVKTEYTLCIPWRDSARDLHRQIGVLDGNCTANSEHNKEWRYVLVTDEYEEEWKP